MRNGPYDWTSPFIGLQLATDLGDFIFVRNILLSIKERVDGRPIGSLAAGTAMVSLWFLAFAQFLATLVVFVWRRDWLRPLAAIAATATITLVLVFAMPPLWVDVLAVAALTGGLLSLRVPSEWLRRGWRAATATTSRSRRWRRGSGPASSRG